MKAGILISIEGIDGSGKSTIAAYLNQTLHHKRYDSLLTTEPGKTALGKKLKDILQHNKEIICDKAEFLLFAANRAQHFKEVVIPALSEDKIVISDRMADSSLAYQGWGRNLDRTMIQSVNKWTMNGINPNLTLYLSIDIDTALSRLKKRDLTLSSFEKETRDFWKRVKKGFETIFSKQTNVISLDGTLSKEQVEAQAEKAVLDFLAKCNIQPQIKK